MTQVQGYGQPNSRRFTKGPSPIFLAELAETLDLLGLLAEQQASATHTKALKIPTTTKKKKKKAVDRQALCRRRKEAHNFLPTPTLSNGRAILPKFFGPKSLLPQTITWLLNGRTRVISTKAHKFSCRNLKAQVNFPFRGTQLPTILKANTTFTIPSKW